MRAIPLILNYARTCIAAIQEADQEAQLEGVDAAPHTHL